MPRNEKLRDVKIGSKGIQLSIPTFLGAMISLVAVVILFYLSVGRFFVITGEVEESTVDRHAFTLANVLLSSNLLAYNDGTTILRGTLDKNKLDLLQSNSKQLFSALGYPASTTDITITDFDSNNKWSFSGDGPASSVPINSQKETYQVALPVVIRYSNGNVDAGELTLKLTENLLQ